MLIRQLEVQNLGTHFKLRTISELQKWDIKVWAYKWERETNKIFQLLLGIIDNPHSRKWILRTLRHVKC